MDSSLKESLQGLLPVVQGKVNQTSVGMAANVRISTAAAEKIHEGNNYKSVVEFFADNLSSDVQVSFVCSVQEIQRDTSFFGLGLTPIQTKRVTVSFSQGIMAGRFDEIRPAISPVPSSLPQFYLVFTRLS